MLLIIYTFVFTVIFQPRVQGVEPYALFLFTGLLPWLWFSGSLLEATIVFQEQAPLLKKVNFPLEVLPFSKIIAQGVHFLLALPILLVSLLLTHHLSFYAFWVILPLFLELMILMGLSLIVSSLGCYFKDLRDIMQNLLTLWFFATPIIYSLSMIHQPWLKKLLYLNPLTPLWFLYQDVLFFQKHPALMPVGIVSVFAVIVLTLGIMVFRRLQVFLVETA